MKTKTKSTAKEKIIDWIKFGVLLVIIYIVITNSVSFTKVIGNSMDPTLKNGSWIAVDKLSKYFKKPKLGDVVIVHQEQKGYDIIKRVIGIQGDTVSINNGTVFINGLPLPEIYVLGKPFDMEEIMIEEGHIFILGDNRTPGESLDSRDPSVGTVPITTVEGYALVSLFPMYRIMKPLEL